MKLTIKKIDESKIIKNQFKVTISFKCGNSSCHKEDFYFKKEDDVIKLYQALLSECNRWVTQDTIKHQELKECVAYIIDELGVCEELEYEDDNTSFVVSWFNDSGLEHLVTVEK